MRATSITAAAIKRKMAECKLKIGDRIYHKEFFWTGELIDIRAPHGGYLYEPIRGEVRWDDPDLANESINLEEVELYDFKGIIQGAIHRERTQGKKNS